MAGFCGQCGTKKVSLLEGYDGSESIRRYAKQIHLLLTQYPNQNHTPTTLQLREKLKITHAVHDLLWSRVKRTLTELVCLSEFKLEFNENLHEAYSGHDTYLGFVVHNNSQTELLSFHLFWDDPETPDEDDFNAETPYPIQPGEQADFGGSHVFRRPGVKSISDLKVTVTNILMESAVFRASPFKVSIVNPSQTVNNLVTTHAQISIEGRGVVDASGIGKQVTSDKIVSPKWLTLLCAPEFVDLDLVCLEAEQQVNAYRDYINQDVLKEKENNEAEIRLIQLAEEQARRDSEEKARWDAEEQSKLEADDEARAAAAEKARRDSEEKARWDAEEQSKLEADDEARAAAAEKARQGAEALEEMRLEAERHRDNEETSRQKILNLLEKGRHLRDAIPKDLHGAVQCFKQAADLGDKDSQCELAFMFINGLGIEQDNIQAAEWYRRSAEQGNATAQLNLGSMYENGTVVPQDHKAAVERFKLPEIPNLPAPKVTQGNRFLFPDIPKVPAPTDPQDLKAAFEWYSKAANQGNELAQSNLRKLQTRTVVNKHIKKLNGITDVFFSPLIPIFKSRISIFLGAKLSLYSEGDFLLFYDDTVLGSGKKGILFTNKDLLITLGGLVGTSLDYQQILEVSCSGKNLFIRSSTHCSPFDLNLSTSSKGDIKTLVQMLTEIKECWMSV